MILQKKFAKEVIKAKAADIRKKLIGGSLLNIVIEKDDVDALLVAAHYLGQEELMKGDFERHPISN